MKNKLHSILFLFVFCLIVCVLSGFSLFVRQNLIRYYYKLKAKFEIAVFLQPTVNDIGVVREKILTLKNINKLNFIPKEEVLNKLSNFKDEVKLSGGDNPFPDAFSLVPTEECITPSSIEILVSDLLKIDGIDEVKYDRNSVEVMQGLRGLLRITELQMKFVLLVIVFGCIFKFRPAQLKMYLELLKQKTILVGFLIGFISALLSICFIEFLRLNFGLKEFVPISLKGNLVIIGIGFLLVVIFHSHFSDVTEPD